MFETTQAATSSSTDYTALALTLVKMWDLHREAFIVAFVMLLIATGIAAFRKSSLAKWLLFIAIIAGASIIALDHLKQYVAQQKKTAVRDALLSPITAPIRGAGNIVKGIFGFGK